MSSENSLKLGFGKVLKRMREARGVSQNELAQSSGLNRTFISMMERGIRQPSLSTLFSIGKALRIPPADLVGLTERAARRARGKAPFHRL